MNGVSIHIGPGFATADWFWPRFAETNVKTFRVDVLWQWIEKQRGQYAFDSSLVNFDKFLLSGKDKGISPLIVLGYGNPLYDGGGFPVSDEAQAAFVNYATFLANHYKGAVKYYEVWNEWQGDQTQSAANAYARLVSKVSAALKAVDPQIVIFGGGVSGPYDPWTDLLLNAGVLKSMDGFSVHPYVYPNVPELAIDWVAKLEAKAKSAAGGRDVPIYATEIGWATSTDPRGVSRSTAADYLSRYYLLAPMYGFIKATWWYDLFDDGTDQANLFYNFGLYEYYMNPKPAACAMSDVSKLTAAYNPVSARRDANGVWTAKYSNGSTSVFAVWTQDPGTTMSATVSTTSPSGAVINARGICKNANVLSGNGSTLLRAVISNSPTIFTTVSDNIAVQ